MEQSAPLTDNAPTEASARRTFTIMCIAFACNHATVTIPIQLATQILGKAVGNASNAALYGICMLASLVAGPAFVAVLGPKKALVLGMILYTVYVFCFALAAVIGPGDLAWLSWIVAMVGSILGGVGAASLWTAQGAFFGAVVEQISDASGTVLQSVTAQLASTFAIWYLGQEAFWKVMYTVLTNSDWGLLVNIGVAKDTTRKQVTIFLFAGLAALAAAGLLLFGSDARSKNETTAPISSKAKAALALWSDPKIWLLSGSNLTFGFAAAYLGGYINGTFQAQALDPSFVGFLGAIIALIASFSSKFYGVAAEKMGTKMPIFIFGSFCFLVNAILSFISAPEGCIGMPLAPGATPTEVAFWNKDHFPVPANGVCDSALGLPDAPAGKTYHIQSLGPGGWGWGIVVFYIFQGLGRGVYESTNKGIFADFFPGEKSVGAFANCILQNTFASTVTFTMGLAGLGKQEVWFVLIGSVVTVPMLLLASVLNKQSRVDMVDKDGTSIG